MQHGVFRGSALALRRVCRCHPLSGGGFDYVPGSKREEHGTERETNRIQVVENEI